MLFAQFNKAFEKVCAANGVFAFVLATHSFGVPLYAENRVLRMFDGFHVLLVPSRRGTESVPQRFYGLVVGAVHGKGFAVEFP